MSITNINTIIQTELDLLSKLKHIRINNIDWNVNIDENTYDKILMFIADQLKSKYNLKIHSGAITILGKNETFISLCARYEKKLRFYILIEKNHYQKSLECNLSTNYSKSIDLSNGLNFDILQKEIDTENTNHCYYCSKIVYE
jgi:hypothetical protein